VFALDAKEEPPISEGGNCHEADETSKIKTFIISLGNPKSTLGHNLSFLFRQLCIIMIYSLFPTFLCSSRYFSFLFKSRICTYLSVVSPPPPFTKAEIEPFFDLATFPPGISHSITFSTFMKPLFSCLALAFGSLTLSTARALPVRLHSLHSKHTLSLSDSLSS
jgi:hypothetical protein